ncbi:MAG: hypothetical protein E7185_03420 [Erysipelotrichaceae bacterium]|nr:hypothetical protein [Erysipelotrichaceae bacterium]
MPLTTRCITSAMPRKS